MARKTMGLESRTRRCPSVYVSGKVGAGKGDLAGGIGDRGLGSVVSQDSREKSALRRGKGESVYH